MESHREYLATRTKGDECAFAIPAFETPKTVWNRPQYGLTKREYFASMAMQGYLSFGAGSNCEGIAKWSVEVADELIKQLNKQ